MHSAPDLPDDAAATVSRILDDIASARELDVDPTMYRMLGRFANYHDLQAEMNASIQRCWDTEREADARDVAMEREARAREAAFQDAVILLAARQAEADARSAASASRPAKSKPAARTPKRRPRAAPTEMTEKQSYVYELRSGTPRPSFAKIAAALNKHYKRAITAEAVRKLYLRAAEVRARQGASVRPALSLIDGGRQRA